MKFWESVAFYNFVQEIVAKGQRPEDNLWRQGSVPFLNTLAFLKPQVLLVLGKDLAKHLPPIPAEIRVIKIDHPSYRQFNFAEAQAKVRADIESFHGRGLSCP